MHLDDLTIPEPCNADWNAMTGDERRRFCGACQKHVTDLSTFTKPEAQRFLDENPGACVQFTRVRGTMVFEPTPPRPVSLRRPRALVRRVASAAAVALVTSAPAYASSDAEEPGPSLVEWVASWFTQPVVTRGEPPMVEPDAESAAHAEAPTSLIPELEVDPTPIVELGKVEPVRTVRGRPARRD
jgi:hypothetical protein